MFYVKACWQLLRKYPTLFALYLMACTLLSGLFYFGGSARDFFWTHYGKSYYYPVVDVLVEVHSGSSLTQAQFVQKMDQASPVVATEIIPAHVIASKVQEVLMMAPTQSYWGVRLFLATSSDRIAAAQLKAEVETMVGKEHVWSKVSWPSQKSGFMVTVKEWGEWFVMSLLLGFAIIGYLFFYQRIGTWGRVIDCYQRRRHSAWKVLLLLFGLINAFIGVGALFWQGQILSSGGHGLILLLLFMVGTLIIKQKEYGKA